MKKFFYFFGVMLLWALYLATPFSYSEIGEHPLIKPVPKSMLDKSSEHNDFTYEIPFYDKKTNRVGYKEITGRLLKWSYHIFGKDLQRVDGIFSSVEIIRHYREFAIKRGGNVLWEQSDGSRLSFTIPRPEGGKIWCHVTARDGYYELDVVDKNLIEKEPSAIAGGLKAEMDLKGRITVYAILFNFNQTRLREQSKKALQEIADLLLAYPELEIEIQGHTDNLGNDDYNLNLSQKRAEVVRSHLVGLGVDPLRLTAVGYGPFRPVASNNTRDGRAKNRRVELIEK